MSWIKTQSGKRIDFLQPDPEQISLMDIGVSLGRVHRFGGHSPLKVGQHVIEVMNLMLREAAEKEFTFSKVEMSEIALVGLLHDFPEYVIGDIPTPLKRLLAPMITEIESRLLDVMLVKWNLADAYTKWNGLLHWADRMAVQQEAVRYALDGLLVTETAEGFVEEEIAREWVPEDVNVNLSPVTYEEEDVAAAVLRAFVRHMALSGREGLLSPFFRGRFDPTHPIWAENGGMPDDFTEAVMKVTSPIFPQSVFTDHAGYN